MREKVELLDQNPVKGKIGGNPDFLLPWSEVFFREFKGIFN